MIRHAETYPHFSSRVHWPQLCWTWYGMVSCYACAQASFADIKGVCVCVRVFPPACIKPFCPQLLTSCKFKIMFRTFPFLPLLSFTFDHHKCARISSFLIVKAQPGSFFPRRGLNTELWKGLASLSKSPERHCPDSHYPA